MELIFWEIEHKTDPTLTLRAETEGECLNLLRESENPKDYINRIDKLWYGSHSHFEVLKSCLGPERGHDLAEGSESDEIPAEYFER